MSNSTPQLTKREKDAFVRFVSLDICHAGASLPYFGRRAELTAAGDDARSRRRAGRRRSRR
jgi:hypothetical protein